MPEHVVALQALDRGAAAERAMKRLAAALGEASVGRPDESGLIEVRLAADDFDAALQRVWDAVAAAGADDHVAFAEHPGVPQHWRHRLAERPPEAPR